MTAAAARPHERGSWETVADALDRVVGPGRPAGAWTKWCCPVHENDGGRHQPSLIAKHLPDAGRTKVQCRAGCRDEDVLAALGLKVADLYDAPLERTGQARPHVPRPREISAAERALLAAGMSTVQGRKKDLGKQISRWETVTSYPYLDEEGTILGEVVRREARFEHGRDKSFSQRAWDRQAGEWTETGFARVPFQLPMLVEAVRAGTTVYVCEGEKDVYTAESAGLVATTNAGGAASWTEDHARWLHGAHAVVIVADADAAGYRRAQRVLETLTGHVDLVRVVRAATGKDLSDHIQCGHQISELEPIPHLDPFTVGTPAAAAAPSAPAPTLTPDTAPAMPAENATSTGDPMGEYTFTRANEAQTHHSDEVDHIGRQWAGFMQALFSAAVQFAHAAAEQRRLHAENMLRKSEAERIEDEQRTAAERTAVEIRLGKLRDAGWDTASRRELADAVTAAASWSEDSQIARTAMTELTGHVERRYGVRIDPQTGHVAALGDEVTPELLDKMAAAEQGRAHEFRLRRAQQRMVELIAADDTLDQDTREQLYRAVEQWRANPTPRQLDQLTTALTDKGVPEVVRTRVRLVAGFLGNPGAVVPLGELGSTTSTRATMELRRLPAPAIDPGEQIKPTVDRLLTGYRDRLLTGADTEGVRRRLSAAVALMTPEDQQTARERGAAIRANPAKEHKPLWGEHVDRDELATTVRVWATLAPQAEAAAGGAGGLDDATAAALTKQAAKHRKAIDHALKHGVGLHDWERDQLAATLRDVEAGVVTVPELLFLDDKSAAAVDADHADTIAHHHTLVTQRDIETILDSSAAPAGTTRRADKAVGAVMAAQTRLAAGGATLPDYQDTGREEQLLARLHVLGVPEHVRNRVQTHLVEATSEAAIIGKQARRIATSWDERSGAVASARAASRPAGYDSTQRRDGLADSARAAGMDDDTVTQRLAADAGHATPPSAAARTSPRRTTPGAGVNRAYGRGRGRGPERGLGK